MTDTELKMEGEEIFVTVDGNKIARREREGWQSLNSDYRVMDNGPIILVTNAKPVHVEFFEQGSDLSDYDTLRKYLQTP